MKKLFLMMLFVAGTAYATVYVNENNNGVEYTDTPTSNSNKVEVPAVNSISTPAPAAATSAQSASTKEGAGNETGATSTASTYKTFQIVSPASETNIQNQPVIPVQMKVEPNMLPGDKIQLMLDNKPAGTPSSASSQQLGLVERGTHSLYAMIVNNKDQVIKQTESVTFYVHRNSTITSPASH